MDKFLFMSNTGESKQKTAVSTVSLDDYIEAREFRFPKELFGWLKQLKVQDL